MADGYELLRVDFSPSETAGQFTVKVDSDAGQGRARTGLPFYETSKRWRITLLKLLEANDYKLSDFAQEGETDWLVVTGLLSDSGTSFNPRMLRIIGQAMYDALFPMGKVRDVLNRALARAEERSTQLHIRLEFDDSIDKETPIPDYPWELAHDGRGFLAHHQARFSRFIAYDGTEPNLPRTEQLKVLLVSSEASDEEIGLAPLSKKERTAIKKGLQKATDAGVIELATLEQATLSNLRAYLTENKGDKAPQIFHFDGHGLFGKRCNAEDCRTIHTQLSVDSCSKCGVALDEPQGYLVFETEDDEADYVSAKELGELLQKTNFQDSGCTGEVTVAVLSACKSGLALGGESVFNGVAQRLIAHKLPAVLAMRQSIRVDSATKFAEQFYRSLGQRNSLATAVSQGQEAMGAEGNQWYRPVLYLRWRDNDGGQLFETPEDRVEAEPKESVPSYSFINQAPALPYYYVHRPEEIAKVKKILLQESLPGTLVVSAIAGLGGIGKSVLAAALAIEEDIQNRFDGGILWVTLGNEPDILSLLTDWIQALGDNSYKPTSEKAASKHLHTLLNNRHMLMVVDDVWVPAHAEYFRVGREGCCVLVTTREAVIKGAETHDMDVMSADEAMTLLQKAMNRELTEEEIEQASTLAEDVGYLPLALELAAAQIEDGATWDELLTDLQEEIARLENFVMPGDQFAGSGATDDRNRSLIASFNLSLTRLPPDQLRQFTWLGILPEDISITERMAGTLWQLPSRQSRTILSFLKRRSLLLAGPKQRDGKPSYRLHDIVRYLTQKLIQDPIECTEGSLPGLELTLPEAHRHLVEIYRQQLPNGLWHELAPDGYIHGQLMWHLDQAQQTDEVHRIFEERTKTGRNGWYEACARLGQPALFVSHLLQSWDLAERLYETEPHRAIVLQMRYALMRATMNNLVGNIPAELIKVFVEKEFWQPVQGLAYVEQIYDLSQRLRALDLLLPLLPQELYGEVLQIVENLPSESARARGLIIVVKHVPDFGAKVLDVVVRMREEYSRASALFDLAPYLPKSLFKDALNTAQKIGAIADQSYARCGVLRVQPELLSSNTITLLENIQSERRRSDALRGLAEHLPEHLFEQALRTTAKIQSERRRSYALHKLIQHLPEKLFESALHITTQIQSEKHGSYALRGLAPYLPKYLFEQALCIAAEIQSEGHRSYALRGLAEYLPEELFEQALGITAKIQDEGSRSAALRGLAEYLPEELFEQALGITAKMQGEDCRSYALYGLAPYLPEHLFEEALHIAAKIQSQGIRSFALSGLAQCIYTLRLNIFEILCKIRDERSRSTALRDLAEYLPEELFEQALGITVKIQDEGSRSAALCGLAEYLPEELFEQALGITAKIQDEGSRSAALCGLAEYLPEELFEQALGITAKIQDEGSRSAALRGLAEHLPEELFEQALQITTKIQDEGSRVDGLYGLAKNFNEFFQKTLVGIFKVKNELHRSSLLARLVEHLPEELFEQALQIIVEIQSEKHRSYALRGLVQYLPEELFEQALQITVEIQSEKHRSYALRGLVQYLPEELFEQALQIISEVQDEDCRASALRGLTQHLSEALYGQVLQIILEIQDEGHQSYTLIRLVRYLPEQLYGQVLQIISSMQSERHQSSALRGLVQYLPEELFEQALQITAKIQSEKHRSYALGGLAEHLPKHLFGQVLQITVKIQDEGRRAAALIELAKCIDTLRPKILESVCKIQSEKHRSSALGGIAQYLPEELFEQALQIITKMQSEKHRSYALRGLVQYLPEELFEQALQIIAKIQAEDRRWSSLGSTAQYLPAYLFEQALQITIEIQSEERRSSALRGIAQHLPAYLFEQVLQIIVEIQDEDCCASTLCGIAQYLPEELFEQALQIIDEIQDEKHRSFGLGGLVVHLPERFLLRALNVLASIGDDPQRAEALSKFLPCFEWTVISFNRWSEILHDLTFCRRQDLIEDLPKLAPAILHYGNEDTLREVVTVMEEVCEQWR